MRDYFERAAFMMVNTRLRRRRRLGPAHAMRKHGAGDAPRTPASLPATPHPPLPLTPTAACRRRTRPSPTTPRWWRHAVIYQIYPRCWADSDGDGIGDLPGITARLPYLRDLGVDAVWLSPFYVSPQNDAGYDVADYRDVDPLFGSLADADALIARAARARPQDHRRPRAQPLLERAPLVPGGARGGARAAPSAPATSSATARASTASCRPTTGRRVFGGRGWTRITEADGTPGQWYLHIFDTTPARLRLDQPRGARRVPTTSSGSGSTAASTASGSTSPTAWSRRTACPTGTAPSPHRPPTATSPAASTTPSPGSGRRCGTRTASTRSTAQWRAGRSTPTARPTASSAPRRGSSPQYARWPSSSAPTRCTRRSTSPSSDAHWDAAQLRAVIESSFAANDGVGAPTTWVLSNHDVVRHASRLGLDQSDTRGPSASARATRSPTPSWACAGPVPPPPSCSRCRAGPTSTRARSSACPRPPTFPTTSARTPPVRRTGGARSAATGAACRSPGSRTHRPSASAPRSGRGCRSRRLRALRRRPAGGRRGLDPGALPHPAAHRRAERLGHGALAATPSPPTRSSRSSRLRRRRPRARSSSPPWRRTRRPARRGGRHGRLRARSPTTPGPDRHHGLGPPLSGGGRARR